MANLIFGGKKIGSDTLQFDVDRGILPEMENNSVTVGKSNGGHLQYSRFKPRILVATFDVRAMSQRAFERELAPLLASDAVQDLIIDDRPDEFWHAKVDGLINLTRAYFLGSGTINFICFDPFSHAISTKTYTMGSDGNIKIPYAGTAPAYPILQQTVVAENGMVGWINSEGAVLQFGDPEETDGEDLVKSDKVLRWNFQALPAGATINTGAVTPYHYYQHNTSHPNKFAGGFNFGRDYTGKAVSGGEDAFPTFTTVTDTAWHGPALHGDLEPNSDGDATGDFIVHARFHFEPEKNAYGRMEFTVETGGTSMLTGVLRDSTLKSTTKVFEWWLNGSWQKSVNLNAKTFKTNLMELQISRKGQAVSLRLATIESMKGDKITKNNGVYTFNATVDGIDEEPADGMTVTALQFSNKARATMYFTDLKFDWINVPYWQNIPNQFDVGDEVTVDVGARKVFVNGAEADLYTVGNQWKQFAISAPEKIQAVVSSWSTQGPSSVTVREAYV